MGDHLGELVPSCGSSCDHRLPSNPPPSLVLYPESTCARRFRLVPSSRLPEEFFEESADRRRVACPSRPVLDFSSRVAAVSRYLKTCTSPRTQSWKRRKKSVYETSNAGDVTILTLAGGDVSGLLPSSRSTSELIRRSSTGSVAIRFELTSRNTSCKQVRSRGR